MGILPGQCKYSTTHRRPSRRVRGQPAVHVGQAVTSIPAVPSKWETAFAHSLSLLRGRDEREVRTFSPSASFSQAKSTLVQDIVYSIISLLYAMYRRVPTYLQFLVALILFLPPLLACMLADGPELHIFREDQCFLEANGPQSMQSQADIERVAADLLTTQNLRLVSTRTLQSLWAGYGHICHVLAAPADDEKLGQDQGQTSLILKYITPPHAPSRASAPDEGHIRKLLSYQVELSFYTHLAPQLPPDVAVASCLASFSSATPPSKAAPPATPNGAAARDVEFGNAMLITDLRPGFPVAGEKRATLTETQVFAALGWLAGFHGHWWARADGLLDRGKLVRPPLEHFARHGDAVIRSAAGDAARVWLNGGYTYLETRRKEYAGLCEDEGSEWSGPLCRSVDGGEASVAELVAQVLAPRAGGAGVSEYETLIHGDVKSENLFTNSKGDKVAFYDFQYVGLGLGVCDLAKLFTCSVPRSMLGKDRRVTQPMGEDEKKLLRFYLERLRQVSGRDYGWDLFVRHWESALVDWLRFQASWGFWGNTEWLEGRVRSILTDQGWREWLRIYTG